MSSVDDLVKSIEECQDIDLLRVMALVQTAKLEGFKGAVAQTYQKSLTDLDPTELPTIERFMDSLKEEAVKAHGEVVKDLLLGLLGLPPD